MSSILWHYSAATNIAMASLNSLAAGALASSSAVDNVTAKAMDYLVTIKLGTFNPAGTNTNYLAPVYASSSLDNAAWSTSVFGNLGSMAFLGVIPLAGASAFQSKVFSVGWGFRGKIPPYFKIHVFNNCGTAAFGASGNSCDYVSMYRTIS